VAAEDHKEREIVRYFRMGETAFMEEEGRKAEEFIRSHPWIAIETGRGKSSWLSGRASRNPLQVFKTTGSPLIRFLMVCNTLAAAGALMGIAVLIGKRNPCAFSNSGLSGSISVAVLRDASQPAIPAPDRSDGPPAGGGRPSRGVESAGSKTHP